MTDQTIKRPLFSIGSVVATPGVIDACGMSRLIECLGRHMLGDWGELDEEDKQANDAAIEDGTRILSAHAIDPAQPASMTGNKVWIITEADRSVTTLLLPDEY